MENKNNDDKSFYYTYSANTQEEVKKIRQKYIPHEDKMEQLRKLDKRVTQKATTVALSIGIIGSLIMGTGMSCVLVWMGKWFIPGIIIGIIGVTIVGSAYPVYNYVLKKEREKIAPEIIRLTDELLQ